MLSLTDLKKHIDAPQPGFLYEPRAFWDVARFSAPAGRQSTQRLDSDRFYNGSKYPIVLTHILYDPAISAIAESFASRGFTDGTIRISSSGNQYLTRDAIPLRMLVSPTEYEPPSPYAASNNLPALTANDGVWGPVGGPLWGLSQWSFHHPLILPKDGAVTFSIGSRIEPDITFDAGDLPDVGAYLQFAEGGDSRSDFYQGNARSFQVAGQRRTVNPSAWVAEPTEEGGSGTDQQYPPTSVLTATEYRRQNVTAAGSTALRGFSLMLDQRWYNWAIISQLATAGGIQSRASATPVKAMCSACGTQESWWRDGAPLSLVSPTRTNALVGKLPVPITLQPGDGLDIELSFGAGTRDNYDSFSVSFGPGYVSVGVSFTGFAAVEA